MLFVMADLGGGATVVFSALRFTFVGVSQNREVMMADCLSDESYCVEHCYAPQVIHAFLRIYPGCACLDNNHGVDMVRTACSPGGASDCVTEGMSKCKLSLWISQLVLHVPEPVGIWRSQLFDVLVPLAVIFHGVFGDVG